MIEAVTIEIVWTNLARDDLLAIYVALAVKNPDAAERVFDRTPELSRLSEMPDPSQPAATPEPRMPRHGHPRNVRILPKSRDFH